MKIRNGFVSNSSSSSFVVSLKQLDQSVVTEIIRRVDRHNACACDGYLEVKKYFVFGRIDDHDQSGLFNYIKENVEEEDWAYED